MLDHQKLRETLNAIAATHDGLDLPWKPNSTGISVETVKRYGDPREYVGGFFGSTSGTGDPGSQKSVRVIVGDVNSAHEVMLWLFRTLDRHAPKATPTMSTQCSTCITIMHEHYDEWVHAEWPCVDYQNAAEVIERWASELELE